MSESNSHQTEISLKKILTSMLIKEYPDIYDISITSSCYDDICRYNVYLLIKYMDMLNLDDPNTVKNKVRQLGKYVLTGQDRIDIVSYADRNDNY
jgi:hypothetical protein